MDWLFARPTPEEANHWLALLSLVLFAIGVVAAGTLGTRPNWPPFSGKYTAGFVAKSCTYLGWVCGIGLFFGIIRMLQIDPATMGRGIWIVLSWIALIVVDVWLLKQAPHDKEIRARNVSKQQQRVAAKNRK